MSQRLNVRIESPTAEIKGICSKIEENGIYSKFIEYMAEVDFEEDDDDSQEVETFSIDKDDIEFFQWEEEVEDSWVEDLKTLNNFLSNGGKIYVCTYYV